MKYINLLLVALLSFATAQAQQQWSDDVNGDYYKSIYTANLPAGNYYIVLHVGDRQLTKAIVITK